MKLKTPVSLMVAIVLGLITAYFGVETMHNNNGRSSPMTRVLIATKDMSPGYVIQADDLDSKVFSIDAVPDKAMHETKEAVGRTVIANIVTGQTMIDAMMAPKGGAGGDWPRSSRVRDACDHHRCFRFQRRRRFAHARLARRCHRNASEG